MIESALAAFPTATAELLSRRELQRRTDTKFVLDQRSVEELIATLGDSYAILRAGEKSIATYRNLYFDTAERQCFHDHRRGRRIRRKVRIRHYPERQLSFLEVKVKRSDLVTDKRRREISFGATVLDERDRQFLDKHAPGLDLAPVLRVNYQRIALVHVGEEERLTIDLALVAEVESRRHALDGAAIVELKQPLHRRASTPAAQALSRFRERAFSKYCAATIWLLPEVRNNRLRPTLRGLDAIGGTP